MPNIAEVFGPQPVTWFGPMALPLAAYSCFRMGQRLGVVPNAIRLDVDEALQLHLGL